jgi:branched-chain amino acid transport system ATP-binding protein
MTAPILELQGVTAGYAGSTVLRDVDLRLEPGRVVAMLGPNGAGKTTLLRVASGLLRPASGTVLVDGHDVTRLGPARRAALGLCLIPEGRGVFAGLTVAENLALQTTGSRSAKPRPGDLDGVLEIFPVLGDRLDERAGRLSGGQQQMLALARCYLAKPRAALLDEVSLGLAPRVVDEIFAGLRALAARGIALLLVEQYVTRALAMADAVHLVRRGQVVFTGRPGELDQVALADGYLGAGR